MSGNMVRYAVQHRTLFRYKHPVRFARCNLRLQPIDWAGQHVEQFDLEISPKAMIHPARSGEGVVNVTRMQIEMDAEELSIVSRARVVVDRKRPEPCPHDLTVGEIARMALEVADTSGLSPASYLYPSRHIALFPEIAGWAREHLKSDRGVVDAGLALTRAIEKEFLYDGNATLIDTSPLDAFEARRGVCQDFAQIMISGCRAAGLPAAYVSGYLRTFPPPGQPRLVGADATHAWVLIWCGPDRGWIGFDPTNGCLMGSDHIITAVGRDYADVAPIDGIFLGLDGQEIKVEVDVEPIDERSAEPLQLAKVGGR